jgi:nicotinamide-nucleotide amidase
MSRRLLTAEFLAVGSELTVGETRDTNSSEMAASLTAEGVRVLRMAALPDDLDVVRLAFAGALERAELVVSTGGLGPTPDDLTREAVALAVGETTTVDPDLEAWLRAMWERRGIPFPTINLKQAWLIPSATALPNPNGTAPGWWVDRPDGRVVVTLPGPPREMRPMWREQALPRLRERGLGRPTAIRTLRLAGIGESQLADLLGDELLRAPNPDVATYARADAVDVRISAVADPGPSIDDERRAAEAMADEVERRVLETVGRHVWARGDTTWPEEIGAALAGLGWNAAVSELGTGGSFAALLGDVDWLVLAERRADGRPAAADVRHEAARVREAAAADVGVAVAARPRGRDTAVSIAVVTPERTRRERRIAFLGGQHGRQRAALAAADVLLAALREEPARAGRRRVSPGRDDQRREARRRPS